MFRLKIRLGLVLAALLVGCRPTSQLATPTIAPGAATLSSTPLPSATPLPTKMPPKPPIRVFTDVVLGIAFDIPDEWEIAEARIGSDAFFTVQDAAGVSQSVLRFTIVEASPITLTRFLENVRSGAWGPYIRSVQPMRMGELDALRLELMPGDDRPPLIWFVACPSGLVASFRPDSDPTLAESALRTLRAAPVKDQTDPSIRPTPMVKPTWTSTTTVISAPSTPNPGWATYDNPEYHITLQYPANWGPIVGYSDGRLGGSDGFFKFDAIGLEDWMLDKLCEQEIHHHLLPFGSRPQIVRTQVQGQAACLILPSVDQLAGMKGWTTLIGAYPRPIQLGNTTHYLYYWRLSADQEHLLDIARTIRFMALPPLASLVVEEYPIVATGVYTPDRMEYTQLISPTILEKRRAWREFSPEKWQAQVNQVLARFGYRIALKEKSGQPRYSFCDLYQGDKLIQSDLLTGGSAIVDRGGEDWAVFLRDVTDQGFLIRRESIERWSLAQHANTWPVFAGDDRVTLEVETLPQQKMVTVRRGNKMSVTIPVPGPRVDNPVKGLWAWEGRWVLEMDGDVWVEGASWKEMTGYDEVFGWRLLNGQPLYFFRQGDHIGVSYAGQVLPHQYDEVIHYQCCEPAIFNVGGNETMVWFHARRDGMWYYVEMGIY